MSASVSESRINENSHFVEAMLMTPKMTTTTEVSMSAFRGRPRRGCTLAKNFEAGRPPSRANAKIIRLLVVMTEIVAKARHTSGNMRRQMAPAVFLVALSKIWSNGPAPDLMTC